MSQIDEGEKCNSNEIQEETKGKYKIGVELLVQRCELEERGSSDEEIGGKRREKRSENKIRNTVLDDRDV